MVSLAVADDDLFLEHHAPAGHPEREARLLAARRGLKSGSTRLDLSALEARDASVDELTRAHSPSHIKLVESTRGSSGYFDGDTYYSPHSAAAAIRAAGGCIAAVQALEEGADYAFCLGRPPGHHATASKAMGFCVLNNVAIAALAALSNGKQRIAIVDWDVHHGNGTEDIFYSRQDVLYVSLHQSPQYPGTGGVNRVGVGPGRGFTVNVPMAAGAGDAAYALAFDRVVVPIIEQYAPDLLIVSAGYDAHQRDPLGGMEVSDQGYRQMTRALMAALPDRGVGRLMFALEGGYDETGLEGAVAHTVAALHGNEDQAAPSASVSRTHQADVSRAIEAQTDFWELTQL